MASSRRRVRVQSITYQGENINAYEVVDPDGSSLPAFTAGAHVDVFLQDGRIRQFSLCNDPAERNRYVFAVQREDGGSGGSLAVFREIQVGKFVTVSDPRNNFPLVEDAERHLLLAGGIGVTPMMAMVHRLQAIGAPFALHYCTRSAEKTAFAEDLAPLVARGVAVIHHDGGRPENGLDVAGLLKAFEAGTHLYFCGPVGFMRAAKAASAHWPKGTVHSEYFSPVGDVAASASCVGAAKQPAAAGFRIELAKSGTVYDVPGDKSIVQVLRDNGIDVETSCESGLCGTCKTRYLAGEPEHNDYILDDDEQEEFVMICSARCKTPVLVLDL